MENAAEKIRGVFLSRSQLTAGTPPLGFDGS
jgi:hypothetical protein